MATQTQTVDITCYYSAPDGKGRRGIRCRQTAEGFELMVYYPTIERGASGAPSIQRRATVEEARACWLAHTRQWKAQGLRLSRSFGQQLPQAA